MKYMSPGDWIALAAMLLTAVSMWTTATVFIFRYLIKIESRLQNLELHVLGDLRQTAQVALSANRVQAI